MTIQWL